ncbi:MAG: multicopper oxidase domain-containing protein [Acidobacteriota bacterium]
MGILAAQKMAWAFGNSTTAIRKFVKRLPSLGLNPLAANEDGLYIPVASPIKRTIAGPKGPYTVDYYKFQISQYTQKLHGDLPGTGARFIGYQDITNGKTPDSKYLGGVIIAKSGTPIQATFVNKMPPSHILPVDTSAPVAGVDPLGDPNRAAVHFHGGEVPWMSDGGPFDWFAADGRTGLSFVNNQIPGANPNGAAVGEAEYYYPMAQSARLGWYHDHAFGLTRINAYAGMASGLLIVDNFEENLINLGILPTLPGYLRYGIPLVIQDKTFWAGPDGDDPNYPVSGAKPGDLWYPWQYESSRWGVGPTGVGQNDPTALPVSTVPEFFADTMLVNGCPYPYLAVEPRHYRFRILNGSQARFFNLQLYYAQSGDAGEPDLKKAGPRMIQIGTEGGFLRFPVALNNPPVPFSATFDTAGDLVPGTLKYNLLVAPGERADVIIDFSKCPMGSKIILYSDTPAPFPGGDSINDYHTGGTIGFGTSTTASGQGPNTQTIMQFRVGPFNTLGQGTKADSPTLGLLEALAVSKLGVNPLPGVESFALATLRKAGVKERWLSLNEDFDEFGRLLQRLGTIDSFHPSNDTPVASPGYGHSGSNWLGTPLEDTPTEIAREGDVEVWHIVNTTADSHPMHFHLVNVQVLQRTPFDLANYGSGIPTFTGSPTGPDPNEKGWKETVRMNPGEVTSVVMRVKLPAVPFTVPNSPRLAAQGIFGAEYVWHCHILEHEEHDMMRPFVVIPK